MNWWALPPLTGAVALSAVLLRRWPPLALGLLLAGLYCLASARPAAPGGCDAPADPADRPGGLLHRGHAVTEALDHRGRADHRYLQVYVIMDGSVLFWRPFGRPTSPLATSQVVTATLSTIIAWLIGYLIRQGHAHADALRSQAELQAVTAERLRIARELHDMVAHSIGVIAIQAGTGRRVIDTQPAEARNALSAIEAASRETLSGLRRMLGALRRTEPQGMPGLAAPNPAPGLADLDRLAATTMDAGIQVDVQWQGQRYPVPADIDLSAYRIVQEAVANVVRHSGASSCRVLIDHRGPGAVHRGNRRRPRRGHRRRRIRHRRHARANHPAGRPARRGPRPGGGFRVAARLPVDAGAQ